ncbi:MAG: radical SAM family heme chaperone HemW [Anaerolineae bacterium]|nr:radical SAM family heme chaperone HemW [Anaerolineae bacterium]
MNPNIAPMLGMYVHIPWCPTRCIYCDFNTYVEGNPDLKAGYQAALLREIRESGSSLKRPPLNTIFFGGGTPTTLDPTQLIKLVDTVSAAFNLQADAEITTEANPGTLSLSYLRELRQGGINRLSMGVQSFSDYELKFLSRLHNSREARKAVENARAAGFENVSLDLIFNLPQQTLEQWLSNLYEAIKLEPDHLSIYSLIVEPGTPLHRQVAQGNVPQPDDDVAADMYAATIDTLAQAGYMQYEISNWAKSKGEPDWETPALASAHNLIYWRNQSYLGIGAGAFGTVNGKRWANVKRPQSYMGRVGTGGRLGLARDEATFETLTPQTAMAEHMMLGLRLVREGVNSQAFEARFGVALEAQYAEAVAYGLERNLTEWIDSPTGPRLRLTRQGRFLANQVSVQFVE